MATVKWICKNCGKTTMVATYENPNTNHTDYGYCKAIPITEPASKRKHVFVRA